MKLECKNALPRQTNKQKKTYNKLKKWTHNTYFYLFLFFIFGGGVVVVLNIRHICKYKYKYEYKYIHINSSKNNQPPSVKLVNKERKIDGVAMLLTRRNLRLLKGAGRWPCRADIACGEWSYTGRKFCCNRLFIFLSRFLSWKVMFRYFVSFFFLW